jgi:hypothetical protein
MVVYLFNINISALVLHFIAQSPAKVQRNSDTAAIAYKNLHIFIEDGEGSS